MPHGAVQGRGRGVQVPGANRTGAGAGGRGLGGEDGTGPAATVPAPGAPAAAPGTAATAPRGPGTPSAAATSRTAAARSGVPAPGTRSGGSSLDGLAGRPPSTGASPSTAPSPPGPTAAGASPVTQVAPLASGRAATALTPSPATPSPAMLAPAVPPSAAIGTGTGPVAPGPAPAATAGPAPGDMPGVAGQLVRVLSAPRPLANGTYTVTVSLHPESLGTVQATVTAGDARVSVQLVATTSDGALAIRQSLPELHEALAAGGQPTTVTVSGGGAQGSGLGGRAGGTLPGPGQDPAGFSGNGGAGHHGGDRAPSQTPARPSLVPPDGVTVPRPAGASGGGRLVDVHV